MTPPSPAPLSPEAGILADWLDARLATTPEIDWSVDELREAFAGRGWSTARLETLLRELAAALPVGALLLRQEPLGLGRSYLVAEVRALAPGFARTLPRSAR